VVATGSFNEQLELLLQHVYGGKQAALAAALRVSDSTVWRWRSEGRTPRTRSRRAIARLYSEHQNTIVASRRYAAARADFLSATKETPC
jgi:hypothetical protein